MFTEQMLPPSFQTLALTEFKVIAVVTVPNEVSPPCEVTFKVRVTLDEFTVKVSVIPPSFQKPALAHAFVVTVRVRNITSQRRKDIDKVRNLREEECFLQGGGIRT